MSAVCGGFGLNRWATFLWASMILFSWCWGRCVVHPGLYSSRLSFVNCRSGCNVMPDIPASSFIVSAKNRGFPGGECICFLCTSGVTWSYSCIVIALGLSGISP